MKKFRQNILNFFLIVIVLFTASCKDDGVAVNNHPKKPDAVLGGAETPISLEGTVWIHHPDTDPENYDNWFSRCHIPDFRADWGFTPEETIEISFSKDRTYDGSEQMAVNQPTYYKYTAPYITFALDISVDEIQSKFNVLPLTIDNYMDVPAGPDVWSSGIGAKSINHYWYLGKVNGDTMHLQRICCSDIGSNNFSILRDIRLVRIK
jgi:hypothetical protein